MEAEHLCMKCMKGVMTGRYCGYCGSERLTKQEMGNALPLRSILNGRYLVGRILGAGGFGITYLGYDLVNTRRIAIKEFMPDGLVSRTPGQTTVQITGDGEEFADSRQRFLDEARIIYRYRKNPHILQVYSLFEENGTAYYAMEFLEGSDLKHFLKQNGGRISWERLMPIAMQVIDALTVLHRDGVVHRDISPDNIFLSPQGKATLIDFGAARLFVAQRQLTVILKRKYAPIEQYQSKGKQGPWTDIYALAATMYHALTGILPPEATARAYRDEIKTFRQCGITLEPGVEKAIYRALRVEPEERYQSIVDFKNDLLGLPQPVRLVCMEGLYQGMELKLDGYMTVGRNAAVCQLIYPQETRGVSSVHCVFSTKEQGMDAAVRDMGSTYGTWVNGTRISGNGFTPLSAGDRILFGENQVWQIKC